MDKKINTVIFIPSLDLDLSWHEPCVFITLTLCSKQARMSKYEKNKTPAVCTVEYVETLPVEHDIPAFCQSHRGQKPHEQHEV